MHACRPRYKMRSSFAILLLILGVCMSLSPPVRKRDDGTQSLLEITTNLVKCDCFRATYTTGNVSLLIRSDLQDDEGNIVSSVYFLQDNQEFAKLTELSIPADYLHERQVQGMYENNVVLCVVT